MNAGRLDEDCLIKIFRAFWQSGHRVKAKNRRTYLTNDGIRITNGEEFAHKWRPHPCAHYLPHRSWVYRVELTPCSRERGQ